MQSEQPPGFSRFGQFWQCLDVVAEDEDNTMSSGLQLQ